MIGNQPAAAGIVLPDDADVARRWGNRLLDQDQRLIEPEQAVDDPLAGLRGSRKRDEESGHGEVPDDRGLVEVTRGDALDGNRVVGVAEDVGETGDDLAAEMIR